MKKVRLKEFASEVVELGKGTIPGSPEYESLVDIFEKLEYGEVVIKVIKGDVESISVTNHYKPVIVKDPLDK